MIYKLRLQWYWSSVKIYLKRNQQTLFIIFALALPVASETEFFYSIAHLMSLPVLSLVGEQGDFQGNLVTLLFLLIVFIAVAHLQKNAILGEPLTEFIKTQPITQAQQLFTHCKVILIANNIAWLFLAWPLFPYPYGDNDLIKILLFFLDIIAIAILIIYVQLIYLLTPVLLWVLLPVIATAFVGLCGISIAYVEAIAAIGFILSLMILSGFSFTLESMLSLKVQRKTQSNFHLSKAPLLGIYIKMLATESRYTTAIFLGCYVTVSYVVIYLMSKKGGLPYFQIYMVILSYLLSNFYNVFSATRKDMAEMLKTLPISRNFFMFWDVAFLSGAAFFLSSPLGIYFSLQKQFDFVAYLVLFAGIIPMLLLLYFVRSKMIKNGAAGGIAVCIIWILLCIQIEG